ncbi:MAG: helix-turn-helix domain-containing protein [Promethearchaeota archaeon]
MTGESRFELAYVPEGEKKRAIIEMLRRTDYSPIDIFQCFFGLSGLEISVFLIVRRGINSVKDIAEIVKRNPSSVHRILRRLFQLGLFHRERIPGEGQGYYYLYTAISTEDLSLKIKKLADDMRSRVYSFVEDTSWLDRIENDLLIEI